MWEHSHCWLDKESLKKVILVRKWGQRQDHKPLYPRQSRLLPSTGPGLLGGCWG